VQSAALGALRHHACDAIFGVVLTPGHDHITKKASCPAFSSSRAFRSSLAKNNVLCRTSVSAGTLLDPSSFSSASCRKFPSHRYISLNRIDDRFSDAAAPDRRDVRGSRERRGAFPGAATTDHRA